MLVKNQFMKIKIKIKNSLFNKVTVIRIKKEISLKLYCKNLVLVIMVAAKYLCVQILNLHKPLSAITQCSH